MSQQQSDFDKKIDNLNSLVKEGVRDEVHNAVSSIVDKQNQLEVKQISLESEQTILKSRVSEIETVLATLKSNPPSNITPLASLASLASLPCNLPAKDSASTESDHNDPVKIAERILTDSKTKNIVGFAPIEKSDFDRLKADNNLATDTEVMKAAFHEFADGEMKVPDYILANLSIVRLFTPKNPSSKRLYVEFKDQITADLVWSYAKNLQSGIKMKPWVPPQFHERFSAIDRHAYQLRNGSVKFKTSIKFGISDIIYMQKPIYGGYWTDVPLDSFPPIDFSIGSVRSSSYPPCFRRRPSSLRVEKSHRMQLICRPY
jgi:hypothetical protein